MTESNPNARLEAFSDGVFAFALTLLIVDVKIPATERIGSTAEFWLVLGRLVPSMLAFLLSFFIVLITWVNHHASMKLVDKSSALFMFANGILLLSVVILPFPTALLGEHILTDHAAPAVILYEGLIAFQAIGWVLTIEAALKGGLLRSKKAETSARLSRKMAYGSFALYSICAVVAIWAPLAIAIFTTLLWLFWLGYGMTLKNE